VNANVASRNAISIQLNNLTLGKWLLQNGMGIVVGTLIAKLWCHHGVITEIKVDIACSEIITCICLAYGGRFSVTIFSRRPLASIATRNISR
jgi:hypothetical protein